MAQITAAMVKDLRTITGSAMMDCKKALVECDGDMEAAKEVLRKKGAKIAAKKADREINDGAIKAVSSDDLKAAALVQIGCETDFVARNDKFQEFLTATAEKTLVEGAEDFAAKNEAMFTAIIGEVGENIQYVSGVKMEAADNAVVASYVHSNGKIGVLVEVAADADVKAEDLAAVGRDIAMHAAASTVSALRVEDLDPAVVEKEKQFQIEQAKDSGKPMNIIEKMIEGRMGKFKKEICLLEQAFVKSPDKTITQFLADEGKRLGANLTVNRYHKTQF